MANEFWLNDRQWLAIEPLLPRNQPGARRVDDRRVISGVTPLKCRATTDQRRSAELSSRWKLGAEKRGQLRPFTCPFELKRSKASQQSGNACGVPPVGAPCCRHTASVQFASNVFQSYEARRLNFTNYRPQGQGAHVRSTLCR